MSLRIEKINKLVKHNIGDIMLKNLSFKEGVFVTVVKVDTSSDLRYTRVFVSVFPEREAGYVQKTLEKELYELQGELNKTLHMKPLPRLEFRMDFTEAKADKIEKILREIDRS
jgi:ribosome-binding factor A